MSNNEIDWTSGENPYAYAEGGAQDIFDSETAFTVNASFPTPEARQEQLDIALTLNPWFEVGLGDVRFENLIIRAQLEEWDDAKFARNLAGTSWGRAIYFQMRAPTGGGGSGLTREQNIENIKAQLRSNSNVLGLGLSEEQIAQLATTAVDENQNDAVLTESVFALVDPNAIVSGDIKTLANRLYQESIGVRATLGAGQAMEYAIQIVSGNMSEGTALQEIRDNAGVENPQYASLISKGYNLNDYDTLFEQIKNTVQRYGVALTDDAIGSIAELAMDREFDDTQIINEIFDNFDVSLGVESGTLSAKQEAIIAAAREYRLDITEAEALNLAIRFTRNELDDAGIDQILQTRAQDETAYGDLIDLNIDIDSYESALASITSASRTLGISLSDSQLSNLATQAMQFEWNDQQITNELFAQLDVGQGLVTGTILGLRNTIRQRAYAQRVVLTDADATQLAIDMASGNMDETGLQAWIDERAIADNPDYQTEIEFGLDLNTVDTARASIADAITKLGLNPNNFNVEELAQQAVSNSWDNNQLTDALLTNIGIDTEIGDGLISQKINQIKALAKQYFVPMSDSTAKTYALQSMRGQITDDTLISVFTDQAKALFPFLNSTIEAGLTPASYFDPMREVLAGQLEMNVEDIDLSQSEWLDMVTSTNEDGSTRTNTMTEVISNARQDSRWAQTANARSSITNAVGILSGMFGVRGF
jgi:hypothetical protein